jgi:putative tryptophan/tyrosine transport system substrate-binding protein
VRLSRRQVVQGAGAVSLGLLAGCGRLPWQASAQSPRRVARIGFLASQTPATASHFREAFEQGLHEYGYIDSQTILIDWRWAEGTLERLPDLAAELVRLPVDLIVTSGPPAIVAAKEATSTIPIVMAVGDDPVRLGFITNLARPGGNITGLATTAAALSPKRLDLLKEVLPGASRVTVLRDANDIRHQTQSSELETAAAVLEVHLTFLDVRDPGEFDAAFRATLRERPDAFIVMHSGFTLVHRARILGFATESRLPGVFEFREWVEAGGLMAYGPRLTAAYRRAAYYVDRILKGAQPADLPVEQPMVFDFAINLQTAQALGLTIPQHVLLQATEVIQ